MKLGVVALVLAITACRGDESALERGDRFWAAQQYPAALAEYRLAARQGTGDPKVLGRVAHAYIVTGQLDRAREEYGRLLKLAPELTDQAVFDYLSLAKAAEARSDRFNLARAIEAALELRPGVDVSHWAPSLARYYAASGDADRALEYFERALATGASAAPPPLLFEIAVLHERQGDCAEATSYFRSFLGREPYGDSANDARFRIGSCAFDLGRRARADGRLQQALDFFSTVIDYGSPANLLDQAWFERGEALVALGRNLEALEAFRRVVDLAPGSDTQTSTRARRRILELQGGTSSPPDIGMRIAAINFETGSHNPVYGSAT